MCVYVCVCVCVRVFSVKTDNINPLMHALPIMMLHESQNIIIVAVSIIIEECFNVVHNQYNNTHTHTHTQHN